MTNEDLDRREGEEDARLDERHSRQPVFNIPSPLLWTIALLVVMYIVPQYVLDEQTGDRFLIALAFSPIRYAYPLAGQGYEWLWTPFTYSALHANVEHILFNVLWLMAFGAPVARRIGAIRYVVFWLFASCAAAFFHAALNWNEVTLLIGASGVVSALMGAACRFAFPRHGGYDRARGHLYPRQSIVDSFKNRTVVIFTAMWFAGNLLIALGLNIVGGDIGPIAWDAHIGGFVFGLLFFGFFDPDRNELRSESDLAIAERAG